MKKNKEKKQQRHLVLIRTYTLKLTLTTINSHLKNCKPAYIILYSLEVIYD